MTSTIREAGKDPVREETGIESFDIKFTRPLTTEGIDLFMVEFLELARKHNKSVWIDGRFEAVRGTPSEHSTIENAPRDAVCVRATIDDRPYIAGEGVVFNLRYLEYENDELKCSTGPVDLADVIVKASTDRVSIPDASSRCPICGRDTPHSALTHEQDEARLLSLLEEGERNSARLKEYDYAGGSANSHVGREMDYQQEIIALKARSGLYYRLRGPANASAPVRETVSPWQPIKTAPEDGRWVRFGMVLRGVQEEMIVRFNAEDGYWVGTNRGAAGRSGNCVPWTHWQEVNRIEDRAGS